MPPQFPRLPSLLRVVAIGLIECCALADQVEFQESGLVAYDIAPTARTARNSPATDWVSARRPGHPQGIEFGRRVVLRLKAAPGGGHPPIPPGVRIIRIVDARTWVLEAPDAPDAIEAAAILARRPGVEVAIPTVRRRSLRRHFPYAPAPNDRYFPLQAALQTDRPGESYLPTGPDLNIRAAWSFNHGEGVTVGVADDGIDLLHADLEPNLTGPHQNFILDSPAGSPMGPASNHGTGVAGVIAAISGNRIGLAGVAPAAHLASWVIFDAKGDLPDDAGMAAMFGHALEDVAVQNHSWGNSDFLFVERRLLEDLAIEEAVTTGRQGRGVLLVRSAGNTRDTDYSFKSGAGDANLDGYASDPRQICVAAIRSDGRFASYSTPGACVLVAAYGGDSRVGDPGLVTTDRTGFAGFNSVFDPVDPGAADYLAGSRRFSGTSASAPLVTGCVALMLSENPALGWRDVPQILALSAHPTDLLDPDLHTNAAGLRISHNTGFGVPDAGVAVRLARDWRPQPAPEIVRTKVTTTRTIPDDGTASPATYRVAVADTLRLQHVQVRVNWEHDRGRDIELTVTSPGGTVSRLLRPGTGDAPVPPEWIFHSVHHLGEGSRGDWTVAFSDHEAGVAGTVSQVELILTGLRISDSDNDGLDDAWENRWFGSLKRGPRDDPDGDGWSNAAEQFAGSNPAINETPFSASLVIFPGERPRLSWPAAASDQFEIWGATEAGQPFSRITNAPGRFPEAGWFPPAGDPSRLFQIRRP